MSKITLVSHDLCPYVQRAAIALTEKQTPFDRQYIDLSDKPAWFRELSPMGKVPVLRIQHGSAVRAIFESSVILEYLEETLPYPLHPKSPLERARHRGWIEFGSAILNRIAAFYNAKTDDTLTEETAGLKAMFAKVEAELPKGAGPWFSGDRFSLVDAVYGPIFRYFDVIDEIVDFGIVGTGGRLSDWRTALADRASVKAAVMPDYNERLLSFLKRRDSALGARTLAAAA